MAIPAEMAAYLNLKYANLAKQAEANIIQANAGMLSAAGSNAKNMAEAGVIPANSAAEVTLRNAQAANQLADAGRANALAGQIPLDGASTRALQGAQGSYYTANAGKTVAEGVGVAQANEQAYEGAGMPPVRRAGTTQQRSILDMPALPSLSPLATPGLLSPTTAAVRPAVLTPAQDPLLMPRARVGVGMSPLLEEEPVRRRAGGPGIYTWGAP